jgi:hypothetical protein
VRRVLYTSVDANIAVEPRPRGFQRGGPEMRKGSSSRNARSSTSSETGAGPNFDGTGV